MADYPSMTEPSVRSANSEFRPINCAYEAVFRPDRMSLGVNPVALNLRFDQSDIEATLQRLAEGVLPAFTK